MIVVRKYIDNGIAKCEVITLEQATKLKWVGCEDRNDWQSLDHCESIASLLTETTGKRYMAITTSACRGFDVIAAPEVGDKVSESFNGDSTPCGEIESISKTMRLIKTTDGSRFYRTSPTSGCWKKHGHSCMIGGHIEERNPHF